jgi:hypothetical protein
VPWPSRSQPWWGAANLNEEPVVAVAAEKGYDLVYLESCGVNAFFIDQGVHWRGPSNAEVIWRTPN